MRHRREARRRRAAARERIASAELPQVTPTTRQGKAFVANQMDDSGNVLAKRVLLVDDVLEVRYLLRMLLANVRQCQVVGEAADGREAIELARQLQPHVVILDVQMPILTGLEALPRILEAAPGTRVIVYSSAEPALEKQAIAAGAFRYLMKGRDPTIVVEAVRDALA